MSSAAAKLEDRSYKRAIGGGLKLKGGETLGAKKKRKPNPAAPTAATTTAADADAARSNSGDAAANAQESKSESVQILSGEEAESALAAAANDGVYDSKTGKLDASKLEAKMNKDKELADAQVRQDKLKLTHNQTFLQLDDKERVGSSKSAHSFAKDYVHSGRKLYEHDKDSASFKLDERSKKKADRYCK